MARRAGDARAGAKEGHAPAAQVAPGVPGLERGSLAGPLRLSSPRLASRPLPSRTWEGAGAMILTLRLLVTRGLAGGGSPPRVAKVSSWTWRTRTPEAPLRAERERGSQRGCSPGLGGAESPPTLDCFQRLLEEPGTSAPLGRPHSCRHSPLATRHSEGRDPALESPGRVPALQLRPSRALHILRTGGFRGQLLPPHPQPGGGVTSESRSLKGVFPLVIFQCESQVRLILR